MNSRITMRDIEECAIFLAVVDYSWNQSAECLAQFEYARALGKPAMILLDHGQDLPDLDGFGPSSVFRLPTGNWSSELAIAMDRFAAGLGMIKEVPHD